MNRRDASLLITQHSAMIAHLDAIEARVTGLLLAVGQRLDRIEDAVVQLRADVAGLKLELATHHHDADDD